jgi:hypothetical protein
MKEHNILPYDGHAVLIGDSVIDFDWPAITQALLETMPWRTETARIFRPGNARPENDRLVRRHWLYLQRYPSSAGTIPCDHPAPARKGRSVIRCVIQCRSAQSLSAWR